MFLSLEQIKAARALLGWNQKDLARFANLKDDQVHSFEAGRTRSLDVLEAIHQAFITHGLDFVDGGVIPRKVSSYILNSYIELLDDICQAMPEGGEVLKHCVDDRRSSQNVIDKVQRMREMGIKERKTISDQNDFITGDPNDYRHIPDLYFASSEAMLVYLNKVALFVDGAVLVIVNKSLADVFARQFEYWWQKGEKYHVQKT